MDHQDKAASLVHSAKNRLQLLQPFLESLLQHGDCQVQRTGQEISNHLNEVNQKLVLMLGLYRADQADLLQAELSEVYDLLLSMRDQVCDSRIVIDEAIPELQVYGDGRLIQAVLGDAVHNALRYC